LSSETGHNQKQFFSVEAAGVFTVQKILQTGKLFAARGGSGFNQIDKSGIKMARMHGNLPNTAGKLSLAKIR
jgi:hypothetical protein